MSVACCSAAQFYTQVWRLPAATDAQQQTKLQALRIHLILELLDRLLKISITLGGILIIGLAIEGDPKYAHISTGLMSMALISITAIDMVYLVIAGLAVKKRKRALVDSAVLLCVAAALGSMLTGVLGAALSAHHLQHTLIFFVFLVCVYLCFRGVWEMASSLMVMLSFRSTLAHQLHPPQPPVSSKPAAPT